MGPPSGRTDIGPSTLAGAIRQTATFCAMHIERLRMMGQRIIEFDAEVTDSESDRRHGLMGRSAVTPLLIVLPEPTVIPITTVGMLVPIDIAFIDGVGRVFDWVRGAHPGMPAITPKRAWSSVLEVSAGAFDRSGIAVLGAVVTRLRSR